MNFREEYKNSIEIAGPSAEQLERMKSNVLAQAAAPAKKALPLKRIAAVGSAVAACAVISVAAVNILPRISSEATAGGANSPAIAYMDAAADSDEKISYTQANDETAAKSADGCAYDCPPESGDFSVYESQNADAAVNESFAPDEELATVPDEIFDEPQSAASGDVCCNMEDEAPAFALDADFATLILDDVKYILTNTENFTPQGEVVQQLNIFAADGTEYLIEIYDECIVLSCSTNGSLDVIGEYIKAE